jgi:ubiquinol-cytochrome c reductase cytochrome c1 subunit
MRGFAFIAALAALFVAAISPGVLASGNAEDPKEVTWNHGGPFGTFDRAALRRGLQVYREVCASCHGLRFIAFRNLLDIGLNEDQVKAIAAEYTVIRAVNNGAMPPDLSLIVKARKGGENYIYSILTGYAEPPGDVTLAEGMAYNPYYPNHQIAMAPPLDDESVDYADGTTNSRDQIAHDVVNFLAWAAEPSLEERKSMGVKVILYLIVLTLVLYGVKRKVWAKLH